MKWKNPFRILGEFLVDRIGEERLAKRNRGLCQEINLLSSGKRGAIKNYYAEKIASVLMVFTVAGIVLLVAVIVNSQNDRSVVQGEVERPGYGMGDRDETFTVAIEGEEETEQLSVHIQDQKYTKKQVKQLLENAEAILDKEIKGENDSLDEVRKPLFFPKSLENGAVSISWLTFPYGLIEDDGSIGEGAKEEGSLVEIQAVLSCQGTEQIYEIGAKIYPPELSQKEQMWGDLRKAVLDADEQGSTGTKMHLPEQINGKEVFWRYPSDGILPFLGLMTVLLPVGIYIQKDQKIHEQAKKRRLQLMMDYPEMLWKLMMLLGAGLTIRGAFYKIAMDYGKQKDRRLRYVYEEMLSTCYEMQSGVAESTAYEQFGKRCELARYMKLGSILSQNLKKGSKGLIGMLENEASSSSEERRNAIRKLGEQAGTRLLFPMILMFGVIVVILIVPAFMSF